MAVLSTLAAVLLADPGNAGSKKEPRAPMMFDIETRKKTKTAIGENLKFSGYANMSVLRERNIRRDTDKVDARGQVSTQIGFALRAELGSLTGFAHVEGVVKQRNRTGKTYAATTKLTAKEALVSYAINDSVHITAGTLRFRDTHRWLADASVDGVHLARKSKGRAFEAAIVRGTRKNTAQYVLLHTSKANQRRKSGVMAMLERDGSEKRVHLAAYDSRKVHEHLNQEWSVGLVAGDAANGREMGVGADWRIHRKLGQGKRNPQLTVGLAIGSAGFQQSGLHSNKTYDGGQTQFNRYGFVYQPQLTNMTVATVAYGVRPSRKFSMDVVGHVYAQTQPGEGAPVARVTGDLSGRSSFLGAEVSVVAGWRPSKKTKVEFGAGRFLPGAAYLDRRPVDRMFARVSVSF